MKEPPSRASAFGVLRTLDGEPSTALFGISEAATESRGKQQKTCHRDREQTAMIGCFNEGIFRAMDDDEPGQPVDFLSKKREKEDEAELNVDELENAIADGIRAVFSQGAATPENLLRALVYAANGLAADMADDDDELCQKIYCAAFMRCADLEVVREILHSKK